jgi:cytosine/adenosine deaminase-related metal-dependent hydrolase
MHLAESREELELLRDGAGPFQELLDERSMWDSGAIPHGSRPLDYLQLLARAPQSLVVHGNYLDDEERGFLAASRQRMSLVYCPRTHAYFGHVPYPLAETLAAGVRVVLGTDSRASNPDLDLWAEMQFAAKAHPKVTPADVLQMGTLASAEALGCADNVGSLSAGKYANFVAMPLTDESRNDADAVLAALLAGERSSSRAVWLRGKRI